MEVENIEKNIKTVVDIDEDDTENTTLCAEYVKDIYKYLRECEVCITEHFLSIR